MGYHLVLILPLGIDEAGTMGVNKVAIHQSASVVQIYQLFCPKAV